MYSCLPLKDSFGLLSKKLQKFLIEPSEVCMRLVYDIFNTELRYEETNNKLEHTGE